MDKPVSLTNDIFWVGVNDHKTELFEAIWPLPHGVSYNAYLIRDVKTAVIDAVKNDFAETYLSGIREVLGGKPLDYLIINHMEPDHSGAVGKLLETYPQMRIVGNARTAEFLLHFYGIGRNVTVIKDNDTLALGRHTIRFLLAPMVHWPETMLSYEEQANILFSGDAFGGFGALDAGIFDDEVDVHFFEDETRRYFSNIVGKYSAMVQKAIARLAGLDIAVVASTHGPVYRRNPRHIIELYSSWSRYKTQEGVVVVCASMYGNTRRMADALARGLSEENVREIRAHDVSTTHLSFIINDIWRFKGIVFAAPTYNGRLFPLMESVVEFLENENIKNHVVGLIECHAWSGGALPVMEAFAEKSGLEVIRPVISARCSPTEAEFNACRALAANMAQALRLPVA